MMESQHELMNICWKLLEDENPPSRVFSIIGQFLAQDTNQSSKRAMQLIDEHKIDLKIASLLLTYQNDDRANLLYCLSNFVVGSESADYFMAKRVNLLEEVVNLMKYSTDRKMYRKLVIVIGNLTVDVCNEKNAFYEFARRQLLPLFHERMTMESSDWLLLETLNLV